jgi:hypothetical protein
VLTLTRTQEEAFMFARAASRLVEMQSSQVRACVLWCVACADVVDTASLSCIVPLAQVAWRAVARVNDWE